MTKVERMVGEGDKWGEFGYQPTGKKGYQPQGVVMHPSSRPNPQGGYQPATAQDRPAAPTGGSGVQPPPKSG